MTCDTQNSFVHKRHFVVRIKPHQWKLEKINYEKSHLSTERTTMKRGQKNYTRTAPPSSRSKMPAGRNTVAWNSFIIRNSTYFISSESTDVIFSYTKKLATKFITRGADKWCWWSLPLQKHFLKLINFQLVSKMLIP